MIVGTVKRNYKMKTTIAKKIKHQCKIFSAIKKIAEKKDVTYDTEIYITPQRAYLIISHKIYKNRYTHLELRGTILYQCEAVHMELAVPNSIEYVLDRLIFCMNKENDECDLKTCKDEFNG